MNISLTPELERIVEAKLHTGFYNNASDVISEALRFMACNEELVYQIKLDKLRAKLAQGEADIQARQFLGLNKDELGAYFEKLKSPLIADQ